MSKTITVPDIGMYPIEVTVNNTKYKLTPGATATVPDGVAALLLGIADNKPKPAEDGWLDQAATLRDVKAMSLPTVTSADNGDVLTVVEGAWAKAEPGGGDEFIITGDLTPTMDASGAITAIAWSNISLDSVEEIDAAIEDGKSIVLRGSFSPVEGVRLDYDFPLTGHADMSGVGSHDNYFFGGQISLVSEGESFDINVYDVVTLISYHLTGVAADAVIKLHNVDHYAFNFTITAGETAGTFVATPDAGVTYAAIAAALAVTPNVYAVLDLGFSNQIIRALFSVDSTASGAESTSALALFYDGTKFQAARLMVSANGASIVIKDT